MVRIAGAGITLVFFTACVPCPHSYTKSSRVKGTVTKNGVPLSRAKVMISHEYNDNVCGMAVKTATTDADGSFKLSKTRGFGLVFTMGDHIYKNQICIETGDKKYIGYTISGIGYPPRSIKLKCDIDSRSRFLDENTPKDDMEATMICTSE
jgi:hypothetical protein